MKRIISILLALVMVSCMTAFTVNAEGITYQTVNIAAPAEAIEVEPGDSYVPVTWTITENEGWGIFRMYIEFDGDVLSFAPGGRTNRPTVKGSYGFFLYNDDIYAALDNIGSVTSNIYGVDTSADPSITKDRSMLLVETVSNTTDSTATGSFFTAFLNVAEDAPAGTYKIKITSNAVDCVSMKGSDYEPVITWFEATIVVKGDEPITPPPAENDSRLGVKGAQIRVATDTVLQGLRFISTIDADLYNSIKEAGNLPTSAESTGVGFGTVVLPASMIPAGETLTKTTANAKVVPAVKLYAAPTAGDNTYKYTACLTDLDQDQYETEYAVRPYVTYMDGETEVTVYGEQYSTTVFAVAEAAYTSNLETQSVNEYLLNKILTVVDPEKYPADSWSGIYKP